MTQPSFVPQSQTATVRGTTPTAGPEFGRPKKPGLLGQPNAASGSGRGTPAPDAGYALTLAERAVHHLTLDAGVDEHDVVAGIAALAAKRAGLAGRGPTMTDVEFALDLFAFRTSSTATAASERKALFAGLGHSYFALRAFVDAVDEADLSQRPGEVHPRVPRS